MRDFLEFLQFYIIVYKENSTEVEWAVVGQGKEPRRGLCGCTRPTAAIVAGIHYPGAFRIFTTGTRMKESRHASSEELPLKGLTLVRSSLFPSLRRIVVWARWACPDLPGTEYSSDDIGFLRMIGRVVAFAIDANFNLRQAEAARAELQCPNES